MNRKLIAVVILVFLLILPGCAMRKASEGVAPSAPPMEDGYNESENRSAAPPYPGGDGSMGGTEQKLIRTASVSLDVEKLKDTIEEIHRLAKAADGFIAQSSEYHPENRASATVTLRVPAASFDKILTDIAALGRVGFTTMGNNDVTMQYVDLEARIRNLERQEKRLLEILDKAETVEDILRIEQELARVRGELESRIAEFRYLRDRVDYATIEISLTETPTASMTVSGSGLKGVWQRGMVGLVKSVNSMLNNLGEFIVLLFSSLPFLFLIAVISVIVIVIARKAGAHKKDS